MLNQHMYVYAEMYVPKALSKTIESLQFDLFVRERAQSKYIRPSWSGDK